MAEENNISKYDALWAYVGVQERAGFALTFDEIAQVGGVVIDHSFLQFKKELTAYGFRVGKISMKEKTVTFLPLDEEDRG